MADEEKDDVVESQKLTKKDRREIEEGACVNCILASFVVTFLMILAMVL